MIFNYKSLKAEAVLFIPSSSSCRGHARLNLINPAPSGPNMYPGLGTTDAFFIKRLSSSAEWRNHA